MSYEQLRTIAEKYPIQGKNALPQLAGEYHRRHEREILDLAAIAADISVDDIVNLRLEPEANPQLLETLHRLGYSEDSFDSLATIEANSIKFNEIKGVYFEFIVRDKLNAGERIGDIQLAPGESAYLAESTNQPGWDVEVVDQSGETVEQVQLKATESMRPIREALERYPDIRVIAPQELEDEAAGMDELLSTDITNENLKNTVDMQLSELSEDAITDILHQGVETAFDAIPFASAALIGMTETGQVLMGRSTVEESLKRGKARLGRSSAYTVIGAGLSAVDAGIISVPTVMALRVAEGRVRHRAAMGEHLEEKTQEITRELQNFSDPTYR